MDCFIAKQIFLFADTNSITNLKNTNKLFSNAFDLLQWDQQALIRTLEQKQFDLFGCLFQKQDFVAKNNLFVAASKMGLGHIVKQMLQDQAIDPCFDDCQAILEAYLTKNETIAKLLLFDSRTSKHCSNDYLAFFQQNKLQSVIYRKFCKENNFIGAEALVFVFPPKFKLFKAVNFIRNMCFAFYVSWFPCQNSNPSKDCC